MPSTAPEIPHFPGSAPAPGRDPARPPGEAADAPASAFVSMLDALLADTPPAPDAEDNTDTKDRADGEESADAEASMDAKIPTAMPVAIPTDTRAEAATAARPQSPGKAADDLPHDLPLDRPLNIPLEPQSVEQSHPRSHLRSVARSVARSEPEPSVKSADAPDAPPETETKPFPATGEIKTPHSTESAAPKIAALAATNADTAAASKPQAASPAPQVAQHPVPVVPLAIEIATLARTGQRRFEIRLDPPELGRIDVRLDVDRDGRVTSHVAVERSDTYDLLRRDAAALERALQQAGLKTAQDGLQFSLRDQNASQRDAREQNPQNSASLAPSDSDKPPAVRDNRCNRATGYGIDIRI